MEICVFPLKLYFSVIQSVFLFVFELCNCCFGMMNCAYYPHLQEKNTRIVPSTVPVHDYGATYNGEVSFCSF